MTDQSEIARRLAAIHERIRDARDWAGVQSDITLVAVSKTLPFESIRAAYSAGQYVFGENRVQEGAEKIALARTEMPDSVWHLIGHLQTNKARHASEAFDVIESVDSLRLAQRLDREADRLARRIPVLMEINVAGEVSKSGLSEAEFWDAASDLIALTHLEIRGLMTVAPLVADPEDVRPVFRRLRELRDQARDRLPLFALNELSMGMSNDYEVAIEEGSTMVRLGRAIFGERPAA